VEKGIALILQIALDTPLRRVFDYLPPADTGGGTPKLGVRVSVPFGRRQLIGVLVGVTQASSVAPAKLKSALALLDDEPVFDHVTFDLLRFASDYYHHPLGEVIAAALPAALRLGQAANGAADLWSLSEAGTRELASPTSRRGPRQRALLKVRFAPIAVIVRTSSIGRFVPEADINAAEGVSRRTPLKTEGLRIRRGIAERPRDCSATTHYKR